MRSFGAAGDFISRRVEWWERSREKDFRALTRNTGHDQFTVSFGCALVHSGEAEMPLSGTGGHRLTKAATVVPNCQMDFVFDEVERNKDVLGLAMFGCVGHRFMGDADQMMHEGAGQTDRDALRVGNLQSRS